MSAAKGLLQAQASATSKSFRPLKRPGDFSFLVDCVAGATLTAKLARRAKGRRPVVKKRSPKESARATRPPRILRCGSARDDGIFRRCIHAPTKNGAHRARRPSGSPAVARRCAGAPKGDGLPALRSEARVRCAQSCVQRQTAVRKLFRFCLCLCWCLCGNDARCCSGPCGAASAGGKDPKGDVQDAHRSPSAHGCGVGESRGRSRTRSEAEGAISGRFLLMSFS